MSGTRVLSPPLPALDGPVDFVHPNSPISIIATPLDAGECILCVPVGSAIVCHISANSAANISTGNYRHSTGIDDFRKVLIRRLKNYSRSVKSANAFRGLTLRKVIEWNSCLGSKGSVGWSEVECNGVGERRGQDLVTALTIRKMGYLASNPGGGSSLTDIELVILITFKFIPHVINTHLLYFAAACMTAATLFLPPCLNPVVMFRWAKACVLIDQSRVSQI